MAPDGRAARARAKKIKPNSYNSTMVHEPWYYCQTELSVGVGSAGGLWQLAPQLRARMVSVRGEFLLASSHCQNSPTVQTRIAIADVSHLQLWKGGTRGGTRRLAGEGSAHELR